MPNWFGSSTVTIRCSDGIASMSDVFVVTVDPINDPPSFSPIPDVVMNEDGNRALDLWNYSYDPETPDSGLTYTMVSNTEPNCGVMLQSGHVISIIPTPNWSGEGEVTVRVTDPEDTWDEYTFTITVNPVNDRPDIANLPDKNGIQGSHWDPWLNLWDYASDIESTDSQLSFSITGNTDEGCGVTIDSNHYIDINPSPSWHGASDVTVRVTDPDGGWDEDVQGVHQPGRSADDRRHT